MLRALNILSPELGSVIEFSRDPLVSYAIIGVVPGF